MSFEKKLIVRLFIAIGAFLPLVAVSLFTIQKLITEQNSVIEANARQTLLIERLQFFNAAQTRQKLLYMLSKDKSQLDSFYEFNQLFNSVLEEIIQLESDRADQHLLHRLKEDSKKVYAFAESGFTMIENGKSTEFVDQYFRSTTAELAQEISETARQLALSAAQHDAEAKEKMSTSILHLKEVIVALAVMAIILSTWATTLIAQIAKQKRLTDEHVARLSQARKEIVEVVAHDVKSPIATIQMTVDLLKEDLPDMSTANEIRESIEMIDRSAKVVNQLITDLLDHAKIESGNLLINSRLCDLGDIVENVASRFQTLAQAKEIRLKLEISSEKLNSSCDPARIDQAVSNLLSNAIKFTPQNGRVTVSCQRSGAGVVISVKDSGPGLSQEQIVHVFDRYWQVRKEGRQGTGLGLSIVKSIVDAHKGKIWVESEPKDGSKFSLSLPS